ncbi:hypothetical protein O1L60_43635 [Streptomyces diastatochromogenes]|nr:hypothetical protein [Streptomyces diastatochromogenes]
MESGRSAVRPSSRRGVDQDEARGLVLGFLDGDVRADPYPLLRRVREAGPVWFGSGTVVLSSYAHCEAALRATDALTPSVAGCPFSASRSREGVERAFSPDAMAVLAPLVRSLVDDRLDSVAARGRLEAVSDLAHPVPMAVLSRLLGLPSADGPWLHRRAMALSPPRTRVRRSAARATRRVRRSTGRRRPSWRRTSPTRCATGPRTPVCCRGCCARRGAATGSPTPRRSRPPVPARPRVRDDRRPRVGRRPGAAAGPARARRPAARAGPRPAPGGGDPASRSSAPGPPAPCRRRPRPVRHARAARHRDGAAARRAHRDPAFRPSPDVFAPDGTSGHLAFGTGPHRCLGAPLARLIAETVLTRFAQRVHGARFALGSPAYRSHAVLRGLRALWVDADGFGGRELPWQPGPA